MNSKSSWFTGKTALVTGAARRIGRETAEALGGEGVNVIVHYNTSCKEAEDLAARIRAIGPKAWTVRADFSRSEAADTAWDPFTAEGPAPIAQA